MGTEIDVGILGRIIGLVSSGPVMHQSMKPRVVLLHDWPPPDTVTPAVVVRAESKLIVSYGTSGEQTVIVTFPRPSAVKVSLTNDEALSGHTLYEYGLKYYSVHKIENSPWLGELERINASHDRHDRRRFLEGKVHYLFALKEETVECIVVERDGTIPQIEIVAA